MQPGARTPEELETLLEDAFVLRATATVGELFCPGAVVAADRREARGDQIAGLLAGLWAGDLGYVAEPRRVLQSGDVALIVGDGALSVVRRAEDRQWRYAIALLLGPQTQPKGSHP